MELAHIKSTPLVSPLQRERKCLAYSGQEGLHKNLLNDYYVPDTVQGARVTIKQNRQGPYSLRDS